MLLGRVYSALKLHLHTKEKINMVISCKISIEELRSTLQHQCSTGMEPLKLSCIGVVLAFFIDVFERPQEFIGAISGLKKRIHIGLLLL